MAAGNLSERAMIEEMFDRARRTETRVTRIAKHLGIDTGGDKPYLNNRGELVVPTRKVGLDEILAALPPDHGGRTDVYCGEDFLVTLHV